MERTCENCGRDIGNTFEEDTLYLDKGLCIDCEDMETPTYEPSPLDFRDHSHELEADDDADEEAEQT